MKFTLFGIPLYTVIELISFIFYIFSYNEYNFTLKKNCFCFNLKHYQSNRYNFIHSLRSRLKASIKYKVKTIRILDITFWHYSLFIGSYYCCMNGNLLTMCEIPYKCSNSIFLKKYSTFNCRICFLIFILTFKLDLQKYLYLK